MSLSGNKLMANRSVPACTVIPVLAYEDVGRAVDWLCSAFGFTERLRIGTHRAQLVVGDGAVVVSEGHPDQGSKTPTNAVSHSVLVRVEDVDRHYERARARGARILHPPTDYPFGERQYSTEDLGGHCWTFSQSIADVEPSEWGATVARQESASSSSEAQQG
ncbi:MAG TPA: VOC family protein [Ktedonobacterales bacterium]